MKTQKVEGTLIIPGVYGDFWYYKLKDYSSDDLIEFGLVRYELQSDTKVFHVAVENGREFPLVVKGPYVLTLATRGKEIQIKEDIEEQDWLEELLKAEPASLAE